MIPQGDTEPRAQNRPSWFRSVRGRLTVCFSLGFALVLALIEFAGLSGIPFLPYAGRLGEQKAEALRSLDLIADLKQERLHRWLEERRDDIHVCAENEMVREYTAHLRTVVGQFAAEPNAEELRTHLRGEAPYRRLAGYLDSVMRTYGVYDEILIADAATGLVLVSTDETAVGKDISGQPYFTSPLRSEESHVGPVVLATRSSRPVFHISHNVSEPESNSGLVDGKRNRPIAVLVMEVSTNDIIRPMLRTGEGLGHGGEALLINREGRILMSLKHPLPDGTVPRPLEYKITAKPAVFATRGQEGVIDSQDYRGEPVLAAYRHIRITPEWGWGLVVKVDKAELFAPLRRETAYILSLGLGGVLAFVGLAVFIAGSLTRPLRVLSHTAERMSAGDRSVRCGLHRKDEIGQLGAAFDSMASSVERTVAELEEREARIRSIVETAMDGIITTDGRGVIESFNSAAERMFGYQAGEVVGKNIMVLLPEQYHEADAAAFEKQLRADKTDLLRKTVELIGKRNDGTTFPNELAISEARVGGRTRFTGIVRDIADRKQMENELRKLSTVVEQSPATVVITDTEGTIQYVNPRFTETTEYTAEEAIGQNPRMLKSGEMPPDAYAEMWGTICRGDTWRGEFHNKKKSGELYWEAASISPVRDSAGAITHFLAVKEDITKRKRAEEELRQYRLGLEETVRRRTADLRTVNESLKGEITERKRSEEEMRRLRLLLKNMIDSMPSLLVAVDAQGRVTHWNRRAEEAVGVSLEEAEGQPLEKAFPAMEAQLAQVGEAIRQREAKSVEKIETYMDGERHFSDVMVYPLVSNGVDGAVIRVDDVTERVRLEEMVIQSEKMLTVGGLAAGMAHEINNPLAAIIQNIQVVLECIASDLVANQEAAQACGTSLEAIRAYMDRQEITELLNTVRTSGGQAAQIVENMLSFSRKSDAHFSTHTLSGLIDQTVELAASDYDLKKKFDFKQIEIVREFDPDLPEVTCEGTKIQQVILNLLKNGAQAMAEQKDQAKPPRFILRTLRDGNMARIEVEDNGPGMTEEIRKRVFEPFFTTKEAGVGTGLGLSVSYFIVTENHGGNMTVQSVPGQGAKFIIQLPLGRTE